ncbi:MAG: subtilisin family serine protease [Flavobacteriaceae bacterium]
MKTHYFLLIAIFVFHYGIAQDTNAWFYIRANDTVFEPVFNTEKNELVYVGDDRILKEVLDRHKIFTFKKTLRKANKVNLHKTFFVISENENLLEGLLNKAGHLFKSGELISEEDKKIFEPNDYGLTSTIGDNIGLPLNLDYLDFINAPKAWYYTTGERDIFIGISDGGIDTSNVEFKGKVRNLRKSPYANGHGISIAATAAAQGDNGIGMVGVCYDCSLLGTTFNNPNNLAQLLELSRAGAKVINCSWGSSIFYQVAQDAINEIYENGTVVVSLQHNASFSKTKGKKLYYPGSYDNVISVSSGMHRYDKVRDNIKWDKGSATPYSENIKGYVGRTIGFTNHDTTSTFKIYSESVRNLNTKVDVLGPSSGLMLYGPYALKKEIEYTQTSPTSSVAPLISGTVGLMFSLYPCLPVDEVEGILKLTALNIDHIEANRPYAGYYGAGMLQTGDAVEMVYQLYSDKETATIEDQDFSRWDFKLTSLSEGVVMRNQIFREDAKLHLKAKNSVVLSQNTHLKPNDNGSISLKIDPTLQKECDLRLRDPSIEK